MEAEGTWPSFPTHGIQGQSRLHTSWSRLDTFGLGIPKGEWWLDDQSYLWRNCLLVFFFILGAALNPSLFLELHSVLPEAMMLPNSYQTLKKKI